MKKLLIAGVAAAALATAAVAGEQPDRRTDIRHTDGTTTTVPLTTGSWPEATGNLSGRAARTDADTVTVHLQFVQSPHKLIITGDLRTGTCEAAWRTVPLGKVSHLSVFDLAHPEPRDRNAS